MAKVSVLEQVESNLISGARVLVWTPKDGRSYSGKILPNTPGRNIVSILYDDGEVKRYKRDVFFLTRLAIGKVMKISLVLWSIGLFILRVLDFHVCMYVCMYVFRQLKLSKELAHMVLCEEITLEAAQVIS